MKKKLVLFLAISLFCAFAFSSCFLFNENTDTKTNTETNTETSTESNTNSKTETSSNTDSSEIKPSNKELEYTLLSDGTYAVSVGEIAGKSEIVIPATYEGKAVTAIKESAFYGCESLTSITIPESITDIGPYAFSGCSGLTNITLPSNITSISNYLFKNCSSLTSITIPSDVTSIGDHAFDGCTGLESIVIPDGVTSMGNGAFFLCTMTIYCEATSKGANWHDNWNSSSCPVVWDCKNTQLSDKSYTEGLLYSLLENGTYEVSVGEATDQSTIIIPAEFEGIAVTSIAENGFANCESLATLFIPASIKTVGENAFDNSDNLKTIYCEATSMPSTFHWSWAPISTNVYWYSESKPSGRFYWHYVNGEITIWQ